MDMVWSRWGSLLGLSDGQQLVGWRSEGGPCMGAYVKEGCPCCGSEGRSTEFITRLSRHTTHTKIILCVSYIHNECMPRFNSHPSNSLHSSAPMHYLKALLSCMYTRCQCLAFLSMMTSKSIHFAR